MSGKKILTERQVEWAYEKWCLGYTHEEIAAALFVHENTVHRALRGRRKVKPRLVYEFANEVAP